MSLNTFVSRIIITKPSIRDFTKETENLRRTKAREISLQSLRVEFSSGYTKESFFTARYTILDGAGINPNIRLRHKTRHYHHKYSQGCNRQGILHYDFPKEGHTSGPNARNLHHKTIGDR